MITQFDEMSDHDDGLVHAHSWASNTPPGARTASTLHADDDGYDGGLVHGHGSAPY